MKFRDSQRPGTGRKPLFGQAMTDPEKRRWDLYKVSPARWQEMLDQQGGVCAICGRADDLSVDHDHECCSGRKSCGVCVRGVLCRRCNRGLASFDDDASLLRQAMIYLRFYHVSPHYVETQEAAVSQA